MSNRAEWLEARRNYLGGTDVAAICGLNQYKTPLDVYLDKIGETAEQEISEAAKWGNYLEDVVARAYADETGFTVEEEPSVIYHPKHEFLAANIDRWADDKKHVLECKTAGFMKSKEWGEEGTDQIPEAYLLQVAWYAAICNVPKVDIAVLIGGQDFRVYTYNRNREFENKLITLACNFWNNNVLKRVTPVCHSLRDVSNLFPIGYNKERTASQDITQKIGELKMLKEQENELQKTMDKLKIEIQEYMQDYDILVDNSGSIVATWKNTAPRSLFDVKRLKQECQDIYLKYVNYTKQSRIFLIK